MANTLPNSPSEIAKAVVERHGGELGFKTNTDVGTTFYFDLPKVDH